MEETGRQVVELIYFYNSEFQELIKKAMVIIKLQIHPSSIECLLSQVVGQVFYVSALT